MKARLIKYGETMQLLLCTGKILTVGTKGAYDFLLSYDNPTRYSGLDKWKDDIISMADYSGQTIAIVDDDGKLQIEDAEMFRYIMEHGQPEFMTVQDYAQRYEKDVTLVRRLCREGRLPGAMQRGTVWLIPDNAPYPSDERKRDGRRWSRQK